MKVSHLNVFAAMWKTFYKTIYKIFGASLKTSRWGRAT